VYFLATESQEKVKIGFSTDPGMRLANHKTSTPEKLHLADTIPCRALDEQMLHRYFTAQRIDKREWFIFDNEIDRFLEDVEFARRAIVTTRIATGQFQPKTESDIVHAMDHISLTEILFEIAYPRGADVTVRHGE
jgi:hypothetical protein